MLSHRFHCVYCIAIVEVLNNRLVFVDNFFHVALDRVGKVADTIEMGRLTGSTRFGQIRGAAARCLRPC